MLIVQFDRSGGRGMNAVQQYRIYFVRSGGHITGAEDFEAANDVEAVRKTEKSIGVLAIELWERGRFVKKLPAESQWSAL
jgi:hypothetical protein